MHAALIICGWKDRDGIEGIIMLRRCEQPRQKERTVRGKIKGTREQGRGRTKQSKKMGYVDEGVSASKSEAE